MVTNTIILKCNWNREKIPNICCKKRHLKQKQIKIKELEKEEKKKER